MLQFKFVDRCSWSNFFTKLQIRGTPDISVPINNVEAQYAGADTSYMKQEITTRIEKALKMDKNLDYITSQSSTGESSITISFLLSTDIEVALNNVRAKYRLSLICSCKI